MSEPKAETITDVDGLVDGTDYCYAVFALYGGTVSEAAVARGTPTDLRAPAALQSLTAEAEDDGTVVLRWVQVEGDATWVRVVLTASAPPALLDPAAVVPCTTININDTSCTFNAPPGDGAFHVTAFVVDPAGNVSAGASFEMIGTTEPATLVALSGDGQVAVVGTPLEPFVVELRAGNGAPIPGFDVEFVSLSGGGTLSAAVATTDDRGNASVTLTLGEDGGVHAVEARAAGLTAPVAFGASAVGFSRQDFQTETQGSQAVAVGDMNADGKQDLLVASSQNSVSVFLNTSPAGISSPTFANAVVVEAGPSAIALAIGDLNKDGFPDVVTTGVDNGAYVLLNTTGVGALVPRFATLANFATGVDPRSIALGDLNGDDAIDIVTGSNVELTMSVLFSTTAPGATTPTFAPKQDFAAGDSTATSVAVGELNADGLPDVVVVSQLGNNVRAFLSATQPGATSFTTSAIIDLPAPVSPRHVLFTDIDQDGAQDLVVSGYDGCLTVIINTTLDGAETPTFGLQTFGLFSCEMHALGDVNGDGLVDVVVGASPSALAVFVNTTAPSGPVTFAPPLFFGAGANPVSTATADFNSDAIMDVAVLPFAGTLVSVMAGR